MRFTISAVLLLAPLASFAAEGATFSDDRCVVRADPDDLVAEEGDLRVPAGRHVADAVALHGNVIVAKGARVKQVVALGGDVVVEDGAVVEKDAVAIGGDVRVLGAAQVGSDAVSIGGRVAATDAQVHGDVVALSLAWGGGTLQAKILEEIHAKGRCRVERAAAKD